MSYISTGIQAFPDGMVDGRLSNNYSAGGDNQGSGQGGFGSFANSPQMPHSDLRGMGAQINNYGGRKSNDSHDLFSQISTTHQVSQFALDQFQNQGYDYRNS